MNTTNRNSKRASIEELEKEAALWDDRVIDPKTWDDCPEALPNFDSIWGNIPTFSDYYDEGDDTEYQMLKEACGLLHECLEWDNGGERNYQKIVDFLNKVRL